MRSHLARLSILAVAAVAIVACGSGAASPAAAPSIKDAWARPGAAGGQSAAYLTITSTSGAADALLSATSPSASKVELHETTTDGAGMMGMHPVARLGIPAGGSVQLKPGSYHLMLMGLTGDLAAGKSIQLDLVFERAGKVVVTAEIRQG
jgi:hypothetical protein